MLLHGAPFHRIQTKKALRRKADVAARRRALSLDQAVVLREREPDLFFLLSEVLLVLLLAGEHRNDGTFAAREQASLGIGLQLGARIGNV